MLRGEKAQRRIRGKRGMIEYLERDKRVVPGLNTKRGYADRVEKIRGGLRRVVILGIAESERRRGDAVVDIEYRAATLEVLCPISFRADQAIPHTFDEAPLIKGVVFLPETVSAR